MPGDAPSRRRAWLEVLGAWGVGLAVLLAAALLGRLGGLVGANAGVLVAAYFLLVPVLLLRRQGVDPASHGIHGDGPGRALLAALAVAAIVFPPYVLGYEGWARLARDASFHLPQNLLRDVPQSARGRPDLGAAPAGVHAWVESDRLYVVNTAAEAAPVRVAGCEGPVDRVGRDGARLTLRGSWPGEAGRPVDAILPPDAGLRCGIAGSDAPAVESLGRLSLQSGASGQAAGTRLDLARTPWWLLELLLVQFAGIALPEEVFYRGYAQGRLAAVFRRRVRFLGADLGWHVPVASALFALSHLVAIPSPFRLAVFFPGLLFGWLRERTGSILAPAILHALSNVLLELMVRTH